MVACEVLLSPRISSFFEVTFLVWGELAMVACEVLLSPRIIASCLLIITPGLSCKITSGAAVDLGGVDGSVGRALVTFFLGFRGGLCCIVKNTHALVCEKPNMT